MHCVFILFIISRNQVQSYHNTDMVWTLSAQTSTHTHTNTHMHRNRKGTESASFRLSMRPTFPLDNMSYCGVWVKKKQEQEAFLAINSRSGKRLNICCILLFLLFSALPLCKSACKRDVYAVYNPVRHTESACALLSVFCSQIQTSRAWSLTIERQRREQDLNLMKRGKREKKGFPEIWRRRRLW